MTDERKRRRARLQWLLKLKVEWVVGLVDVLEGGGLREEKVHAIERECVSLSVLLEQCAVELAKDEHE